MKVTVLGCSGSVPGPDSPASGYLIEAEGFRLVLDLGHGTFGSLQRYVDPADVDAIILSHLHADHCIDLTAYIVALRYGGKGHRLSGPPIPVIGPAGTKDRLSAAYDPLVRDLGLDELFQFEPVLAGDVGPFQVSYAPMNHPTPTNAVRLTHDDRVLAYSADTGESSQLVDLARGANLFLCEASFGPQDEYIPNLHLTAQQAGQHAAKADVERLIVTHIPPWCSRDVQLAEAAAAFPGAVELAAPGGEFWV